MTIMKTKNYTVYETYGDCNKQKVFSSDDKKECDNFISCQVMEVVDNMLAYGSLLAKDVKDEIDRQSAHFSILSLKIEKIVKENLTYDSRWYLGRG